MSTSIQEAAQALIDAVDLNLHFQIPRSAFEPLRAALASATEAGAAPPSMSMFANKADYMIAVRKHYAGSGSPDFDAGVDAGWSAALAHRATAQAQPSGNSGELTFDRAASLAELHNWAMLAFRALNGAGHALREIEPEDTSEKEELDGLIERVEAAAFQFPTITGMGYTQAIMASREARPAPARAGISRVREPAEAGDLMNKPTTKRLNMATGIPDSALLRAIAEDVPDMALSVREHLREIAARLDAHYPSPSRARRRLEQIARAMTALNTPGCERLKEWVAIGPVQRAAFEQAIAALAAAPHPESPEPVAWVRTYSDGSKSLRWKTLATPDERDTPLYTHPLAATSKEAETSQWLSGFEFAMKSLVIDDRIAHFADTTPRDIDPALLEEARKAVDAMNARVNADRARIAEQRAASQSASKEQP